MILFIAEAAVAHCIENIPKEQALKLGSMKNINIFNFELIWIVSLIKLHFVISHLYDCQLR